MLSYGDDPGLGSKGSEGCDSEEADNSASDNERGAGFRGAGAQYTVDCAGEGFNEYGGLVGEFIRDWVKLGNVGNEPLSPAPGKASAISGLQPWGNRSFRVSLTICVPAGCAGRAERYQTSNSAPEGRFYYHSITDIETVSILSFFYYLSNDLVAGNEGKGREAGKVVAALALNHGKVRAADTADYSTEFYPIGPGKLGFRHILEAKKAGRAEGEPGKAS